MNFEDEVRDLLQRRAQDKGFLKEMADGIEKLRTEREMEQSLALIREAQTASKKIVPYLEAINNVLADGKGEIKEPHLVQEKSKTSADLSVSLTWGEHKIPDDYSAGNKIVFVVDLAEKRVIWEQPNLNQHRVVREIFNYEASDFDANMKNFLLTVVSNPLYYEFSNSNYSLK